MRKANNRERSHKDKSRAPRMEDDFGNDYDDDDDDSYGPPDDSKRSILKGKILQAEENLSQVSRASNETRLVQTDEARK